MTNEFHSECSSSTSWSSQPDTEDDWMIAVMLTEEYSQLDGVVSRRLSTLAPVPVVPRINSYFPTLSDANLDHQRLHQRLQAYGLYEVRVSGDGNCQFRALSDQMFKSPEHHKFVRKEVVKQQKEYKSLYESYVPMKYKHSITTVAPVSLKVSANNGIRGSDNNESLAPSEMMEHYEVQALLQENVKVRSSGEWGDHVTLQAAADRIWQREINAYVFTTL